MSLREAPPSAPNLLALGVILVFFASFLAKDISRPWVDNIDFNGAVWSQAAHNILRAGLVETQGASTAFYFGPLPIPETGYYLHHPPLLHLAVTAMFSVFGEHEWAARIIPITCALGSAVLLWLLVADCLGFRTATFCTAVFASLPMALRYGTMVNFEPVILFLILIAFFSLRCRERSGRPVWTGVFFTAIFLGMWVDWPMHLFALVLSAWWFWRGNRSLRRFAWVLLAMAGVSGVLFLFAIQALQPDALRSLQSAFFVRIASDESYRFTEWQWICRVSGSIARHYLPIGLLMASMGAAIAFRRRTQEGFRWIGRACALVFAMDAIFVGVFQNDSYIHEYIAFYFLVPVSVMTGIAINELVLCVENAWAGRIRRIAPLAGVALVLAGMAIGCERTEALQHRFCILDVEKQEPERLIPALGEAIRKRFPPTTRVLCNFMPHYGPQLPYYAEREIAPNLGEADDWRPMIEQTEGEVGGVVWMGDEDAEEILASLPPGKREFVRLENERFCVWTPTSNTALQGEHSRLP